MFIKILPRTRATCGMAVRQYEGASCTHRNTVAVVIPSLFAETVTAPTAAERAGAGLSAVAAGCPSVPGSAAATPSRQPVPDSSAPGTPLVDLTGGPGAAGGDGDRTPEGERTSSSDSGVDVQGPVLDIFGGEGPTADDADSGASGRAGPQGADATMEEAERERQDRALQLLHKQRGGAGGAGEAGGRAQPQHAEVALAGGQGQGRPGGAAAAQAVEVEAEADDEDDMFAERDDDDDGVAAGAGDGAAAGRAVPAAGGAAALHDSYDDAEGYYNFQVGGRGTATGWGLGGECHMAAWALGIHYLFTCRVVTRSWQSGLVMEPSRVVDRVATPPGL